MQSTKQQLPFRRSLLVSLDGGVMADSVEQEPDRYRYFDKCDSESYAIPRGAGLSYAAASFGSQGTSVSHRQFNRIVNFHPDKKTVEVEVGITLHELFGFLSSHNLYLPVQPGFGGITVGGCIAADVHGKNQAKDGLFNSQVDSLVLFHAEHGMLQLSASENPDIFDLTCGGYGLTGQILTAVLRLQDMPGSCVTLTSRAFVDFQSGFQLLEDTAKTNDFVYSWHDMACGKGRIGRGVLHTANFNNHPLQESHVAGVRKPTLSAANRAILPFNAYHKFTMPAVNGCYRFLNRNRAEGRSLCLAEALFPVHKSQSYFGLFGKPGFHEYQVILPSHKALEYVEAVSELAEDMSIVITLASAKTFLGDSRLLRFTGTGLCFAINFPRSGLSARFASQLDSLLIELGGIPNIIKDSRLPQCVVDNCYREADTFRALLVDFDKKRLYRSELSERLGL